MKRAVFPKEMHNFPQKKDIQAVENNLKHEEVHEFRKSSRAAARRMAQKAIARKKEGPPPTKEAPPTVVVEKHSARAAATLHTRTP